MPYDDRRMAGLIIFAGVFQFTIGLMLAAAVDEDYSIQDNYISDLGVRAGAGIFNGSAIVLGLLVLGGAYFLDRALHKRWFTGLLVFTAIGVIGVGIFTEDFPGLHTAFSFVAFLGAGLSAIATYRFTTPPLSYLSLFAGLLSLTCLALFAAKVLGSIGIGGMERMIVYPILAWALGFGGYLMAPGPAKAPS